MLGVSGRGRIVEQPAFRNEIRIERHVFVVFHLVRAAALTTNQLKYRLRSYYTEIIGLGKVLEAHVALALRARAT